MALEYSIDKIKYINILSEDKKTVAYEDNGLYVDIDINAPEGFHKRKIYEKKNVKIVNNFADMLKFNNLWILLIDSTGKPKTKITKQLVYNLLNVYFKMQYLDDLVVREIDYISSLVSERCVDNIMSVMKNKNIIITVEQEIALGRLLRDYIYIDFVTNGLNGNKMIIRKENKLIDYKISRILKYLDINFNHEEIPNFSVEYNLEEINYCDSNGNKYVDSNLDKKEVEKIKKLVDKRRI